MLAVLMLAGCRSASSDPILRHPNALEGTFEPTLENRDPAPGPLVVKGDSDLLKQALLNVIMNGCQAMPEGGVLTVRTRAIRARPHGMATAARFRPTTG